MSGTWELFALTHHLHRSKDPHEVKPSLRPYLMTKRFTMCKTLQLYGGGGGGVALTRWEVGFTIYVVSA
jgi:hypothetical protein